MVITEIVNFNKEDSEAEVRVSDGDYSVECYVYPAEMSVFEKQSNVIDGMCCKNIVKANRKRYEIKKLSQYYAYHLTAKVVDKEKRVVCIGKLIINLDADIPKDIVNGDYINFSVLCLDWN